MGRRHGASQAFLNGPYGTLSSSSGGTGSAAVQTYLPDALSSTLALVNSAGQVQTSYSYDLFGSATSSAGTSDPNPLRYTGLISGPVMPAGPQDNNARDYDPATGQFISQDPLGMSGSGNNLYAYASNDPVDYSDPSGLEEEQLAACGIGALANDIAGAVDGRKHSLGDYFEGAAGGCLQGLVFTIPGAGEALDGLEGADSATAGIDGAEDLTSLPDDFSGDGTGDDDLGEDACTTEPNSFAGNTPVTLADGKTKPIDQVKPGDEVTATDPATGKTASEPVLAVIKGHKNEQFVRLTITAGTGKSRHAGVIVATTGHPFWDATRHAWIDAGNLRPGDHLLSLIHAGVVVSGVQRYDEPSATAYNLTVGTDHDYYVDAATTPILVHNCGRDLDQMAEYGQEPSGFGGLANAGRAYQKHMGRFELPWVGGKQLNAAGRELLEEILTNPVTKWARSLEEGSPVANTVSCPAVLVQHSTLAGISYTSEGSHINEVCKTHTDKKDRRSKASPGSFGNHRAQAGAGALSVSSRDVLAGRPPVRPWPDR